MTTQKAGTKTQTKKVAKPKATAKETLKKTNAKVTTQKIIVRKELKYRYPKGCTDPLKRKSHRQKVRNALRKFERDIAKLKGEDRRLMKEKLATYQAENLV